MDRPLSKRLTAEFVGTAMLLLAVVGSGIVAERLAGGNAGVALLANTIAIGAALFALILSFSGVSGAHFNPLVTITQVLGGFLAIREAIGYLAAQFAGAVVGVIVANALFELPLVYASQKARTGTAQWLSEFVATFGLIFVIAATERIGSRLAVPAAVSAYVSAAIWFTPSASYVNPTVTFARSLSDSYTGIRLMDVPMFAVFQLAGAIVAFYFARWLFAEAEPSE